MSIWFLSGRGNNSIFPTLSYGYFLISMQGKALLTLGWGGSFNIKGVLCMFSYPPLKERLLQATTIKENGCWICSIGHGRYGRVKLDGTDIGLKNHRASWMVHRGQIPKGQCVLHACDTPRCINPDHLFLGSHADNMADRAAKGRNADQRGEKGPGAYLTEEQVLEIRSLWATRCYTLREIGEICGTSKENVNNIVCRYTWKHI